MSLNNEDFAYIRHLVKEQTAVSLQESKQCLVETRLALLARQLRFNSVEALIGNLKGHSEHYDLSSQVVEMVIPQETRFFRDVHTFDLLKKVVLPDLEARRGEKKEISFWCGACATGQEAYSLALLIHDHFPTLVNWKIRILGTDLFLNVLSQARTGVFNAIEIYRGLNSHYFTTYFKKKGNGWAIKDEIRDMVEFEQLDLNAPWDRAIENRSMDIVLLRNILIHFDEETRQKIFLNLRGVLRPDGYVFLGEEESLVDPGLSFQKIQTSLGSFLKPNPLES